MCKLIFLFKRLNKFKVFYILNCKFNLRMYFYFVNSRIPFYLNTLYLLLLFISLNFLSLNISK